MKRLAAYLLLRRRKKPTDPSGMEGRQPPDGSPHFSDSYYFCGRDSSGTSGVFRLGFRPGQETERWCDLILPGLGHLRAAAASQADRGSATTGGAASGTSGIANGDTSGNTGGIASSGLRFECVEPGRTWTVSFTGPMDLEGRTAAVDVDLRFTADTPIVDFSEHGDSWSLAGYLAAQGWSRAWLEKLRDLRQVHYEQGGALRGRIAVDGREQAVSLAAVRDHSFGPRKWSAMRRHVWLMALLEDGSRVNLSLVSYDFLPYMHSGYRVHRGRIEAVTSAPRFEDLPAANPRGSSFTCRFRVGASETLTLECEVQELLEYSMGGDYRFSEGLAAFRLGDRKGVGVCEFGRA